MDKGMLIVVNKTNNVSQKYRLDRLEYMIPTNHVLLI